MTRKIYQVQKLFSLTLIIAFMLSGCAKASYEEWYVAKRGRDFIFNIVDNWSKQRFELEFISLLSNRRLCIANGSWPANEHDIKGSSNLRIGSLNFRQDDVYVLSGGQKYPIKISNFGVYINKKGELGGGPNIIIQPKGHLTGIIPYQDFDGKINSSSKVHRKLIFKTWAIFCDYGDSTGDRKRFADHQ